MFENPHISDEMIENAIKQSFNKFFDIVDNYGFDDLSDNIDFDSLTNKELFINEYHKLLINNCDGMFIKDLTNENIQDKYLYQIEEDWSIEQCFEETIEQDFVA